MDLNSLQRADEKAENVFRISTPYGLISRLDPNQQNKRKVIFWGASFMKLSRELNVQDYIRKTNECLDYIRRECANYELYYEYTNFLNLIIIRTFVGDL